MKMRQKAMFYSPNATMYRLSELNFQFLGDTSHSLFPVNKLTMAPETFNIEYDVIKRSATFVNDPHPSDTT